ncbi:MAG: tRNA lysidine(34) synthetase TilS [Micavibrio aeruginosavorus]|uniref:tRNA(Ile)-lysidine synthase n=1 Tax=Micavibrio aeruginosavorus TaxID=349221 RepID=A0A2W4ZSM5_9BACT|nr:MAG: tRNA lysidine(34) synthetase TilS [Micavibrio aeruginosavorus]
MGFEFSDFEACMARLPDAAVSGGFAVGVSGGPDSMALLHLLSRRAEKHGTIIHAYTVDHALRPESGEEALRVGEWVRGFANVRHSVLRWDGDKPQSRILEEARAARYELIRGQMKKDGVRHLFIAHHQDDQAETFLIRLAKGSGLDGLAAMACVQEVQDIVLLRPLLDVPKEGLVAYCNANNIPYVDDPTNGNERFLRPRLRAARNVLEEEGLTSKRLAVTAARIARARAALEELSQTLFDEAVLNRGENGHIFDLSRLRAAPEELVLRVVLKAMNKINPWGDYPPRLEKVEALCARIREDETFRGATLGGCIFSLDGKRTELQIVKE